MYIICTYLIVGNGGESLPGKTAKNDENCPEKTMIFDLTVINGEIKIFKMTVVNGEIKIHFYCSNRKKMTCLLRILFCDHCINVILFIEQVLVSLWSGLEGRGTLQ